MREWSLPDWTPVPQKVANGAKIWVWNVVQPKWWQPWRKERWVATEYVLDDLPGGPPHA